MPLLKLRQRREHAGFISHPGRNSTYPSEYARRYRAPAPASTIDAITRRRAANNTRRGFLANVAGKIRRLLRLNNG